jgi:hypothetical protein
VRFILKKENNSTFTEKDVSNKANEYYVLWYDAKMKNYLNFLQYVIEKKYTSLKITGILIVDKKEFI